MQGAALETIYVALLNHGPDAWRPVQAIRRAQGVFAIVSRNDDPEDEQWQFGAGSIVRCEMRPMAGREALFAVEIAPLRRLAVVER